MEVSNAIATGRVLIDKLVRADISGCALGMAGLAVGISLDRGQAPYVALREKWPWLGRDVYPHCDDCCFCGFVEGMEAIYRAFDYHVMLTHDMNLDQLIDWVRSIEPPEETEHSQAEDFWSDGVTVYDSLTTKNLELQPSVSK